MSTPSDLPKSAKRLFRPAGRVGGRVYDAMTASCSWFVAATDITAFCQVVGGATSVVNGYSYVIPMTHPDFSWLYAKTLDGEWCGWDQAGNHVSGYKMTVGFSSWPFNFSGTDAFLTVTGQPSGRTLGLPASAGTLTDGTHPAHDPGVYVPGISYAITQHQLLSFNESYYLTFENCVNSAPFRSQPAGCVLYNGPSFSRTTTFAGITTWEVTHNFEVSALSWNGEYGANGNFQEWKPNGVDRHAAVDLNQIFVLP
jgi:hypothetical protein